MPCNDCFNGCADIISDQCVKYTGVTYPDLNINKGDTLRSVEDIIITLINNIRSGEGIFPDYLSDDSCTFVTDFITEDDPITINNILKAYMSSICSLQTTVSGILTTLASLNIPYDLNCLDPDIEDTDTHAVLQGTIDKVCAVSDDLVALELNVNTNYVRVDQIDQYIEDYNEESGASTLMYNKMIPYTILEYHGPLTNFDATGAGTGDWIKIYLCNGLNNTPDKRGFVSVGTTIGMLGGALNPLVDPALPGNPAYSIGSVAGANSVGLTTSQLPSHSHTGVTNTTGNHSHVFREYVQSGSNDGSGGEAAGIFQDGSTQNAGDHFHTLSINSTGGGLAHPNFQPAIGCYYIQYRP